MSKVIDLDPKEFGAEVEQYQGKVLVDFYAPWCGPCKMIAPLVEQIADEDSSIKVVKVNADDSQELMSKFGIRGIPTLLLINEGELVATHVGAANLSKIREFAQQ